MCYPLQVRTLGWMKRLSLSPKGDRGVRERLVNPMKTNPFIPLALSLLAVMAPAASSAAILAQYNFAAASTASTDTDADSTAGPFNVSGGSYPADANTSGFSTTSNSPFIRSSVLTGNAAGAIAGNDYLSFTLTLNPGVIYDLNTLTLKLGGSSDNNGTFNVGACLRTSLDGFANDIGSPISQLVASNAGAATPTYGDFSFNLSALPDITSGTPVTFRIYLTADVSNSPQILRADDFIVNGTAIPEPAISFLGAVGAIGLIGRRRRSA